MSRQPARASASLRTVDVGVTTDLAVAAAEGAGVCIRPLVHKVTDRVTGSTYTVPIPCASTRERVCKPCAEKARRIRMHQCREGWHLTEDPPRHDPAPDDQGRDQADDLDEERALDDGESDNEEDPRRVRSTRHLPGFPDLPSVPVEDRTIGRAFTDEKTGRSYRPSMFLTITLPRTAR